MTAAFIAPRLYRCGESPLATPGHGTLGEPAGFFLPSALRALPSPEGPKGLTIPGYVARARDFLRRHPTGVTVAGSLTVFAALALVLAGKGDEFVSSMTAAPLWILGIAVGLHVIWLIARCEAWHVCVSAAGGLVERRRLYRAGSLGYLGNLFNGQFGLAVRIAALRRSAPAESPKATVLVAAEVPILVVEGALAALMSFTLVGPLNVPWWVPLVCFVVATGIVAALAWVARDRQEGFWKGLAVLRGTRGRTRIIGLVVFAVGAQALRNWLVLRGIGVDASALDSIALLIGMAVIGLLPVGPSLGAATAVLILGA